MGRHKEKIKEPFLITHVFVRMELISCKCPLIAFHINYLIPDSYHMFISQLAVILWMAGRRSRWPLWNRPQLDTLCWISIVGPEVRLLWGPVFYLSPGTAALRPGHSSAQQGPRKSPVAAAVADLQQGRHSTLSRGMSPAPVGGGWTEVRCGLQGTDGWTVCGQCFLWKAIQRVLWQGLCQLLASPLTLFWRLVCWNTRRGFNLVLLNLVCFFKNC